VVSGDGLWWGGVVGGGGLYVVTVGFAWAVWLYEQCRSDWDSWTKG